MLEHFKKHATITLVHVHNKCRNRATDLNIIQLY